MKKVYLVILIFLSMCSCGNQQSAISNQQSNVTISDINKEILVKDTRKIENKFDSYKKNGSYILYNELFRSYKKNVDVVFLGDSITWYCYWNELIDTEFSVMNRGIGSDTTFGVIHRLDEVFEHKPKFIFIMIGINDIYQGFDLNIIADNYRQIISSMKKNNIVPIIQSTLYVSRKYKNRNPVEMNIAVEILNHSLKKIAYDEKLYYLDLNKKLSTGKYLNDKYTFDGIHLNSVGYNIWKDEIEKSEILKQK